MPLSKDEAAKKIQRLIRKWTWSLTVPPAVAGPLLITWAKVWISKRENTPEELYIEASKEQNKIRTKLWSELDAKNAARQAKAEERLAKKALTDAQAQETSIATQLLKQILIEFTDRFCLEVVHDSMDLEPPDNDGDEKFVPKEDDARARKIKRKKSTYKGKQRKKLLDIVNKSSILTKDDKRVAGDFLDQIKTKQDLSFFLCALLTSASPNARVRLVEAALNASKENPASGFDDTTRKKYSSVITNCNKLRDINRKTALQAINSIQSHELAGAILQALLEGASPYTMLALANVGESKTEPNSSSSSSSPPSSPVIKPQVTDFGDADKPVDKRIVNAIKTALADRKKCKISYGQHCAAVYASKILKTNIHAVQLIINIILDKDGGVIRSSAFCKAETNVWTEFEKKGVIRFLQNDCSLNLRQLPAAVRAVEHSKLKTEVQILFLQQVKAAVHGGAQLRKEKEKVKELNKRARANSDTKADPSAKTSSSDRDAAMFAVQANKEIPKLQLQAFKMAIKKAMTMADIFLLLHCILDKECTQDEILNTLTNSSMSSRSVDEQKNMAIEMLDLSLIITNESSKKAAIETIQTNECNTSKSLVAICEAVISGKLPKEVKESLSSTTDGDKIALLTMLNTCNKIKMNQKRN
jgi:hypothetical protein